MAGPPPLQVEVLPSLHLSEAARVGRGVEHLALNVLTHVAVGGPVGACSGGWVGRVRNHGEEAGHDGHLAAAGSVPPTWTLSKIKPVPGLVALQRRMPGDKRPPVEWTLRSTMSFIVMRGCVGQLGLMG